MKEWVFKKRNGDNFTVVAPIEWGLLVLSEQRPELNLRECQLLDWHYIGF